MMGVWPLGKTVVEAEAEEPVLVAVVEAVVLVVLRARRIPSEVMAIAVAVATAAVTVPVVSGTRRASGAFRRWVLPLKLTSAFSAVHERLVALNWVRSKVELSGMPKFEAAADSKRGILSPIVALCIALVPTSTVVQPVSAGAVQFGPEKPFAHTQLQELPDIMLVPPFAQGLLVWQEAARLLAAFCAFCFGRTIKATGTIMAEAARIARTIMSRKNVQSGIPQHRRPTSREGFSAFKSANDDSWPRPIKGEVHRDMGRRLLEGVARPGGGNEANILVNDPERGRLAFVVSLPSQRRIASYLRDRSAGPIFGPLAFNKSKSPNLLAVRPRSRFEATLVARRIRSGRLVKLPLASTSLSPAELCRICRLDKLRDSEDGDVTGNGVPGSIAPPFSSPPSTCLTLGSTGTASGDRLGGVDLLSCPSIDSAITVLIVEDPSEGEDGKRNPFSSEEEPLPKGCGPFLGGAMSTIAAEAPGATPDWITLLSLNVPSDGLRPLSSAARLKCCSPAPSVLLMVVSEGLCRWPQLAFRTKPADSS